MNKQPKLFVALDTTDLDFACRLVKILSPLDVSFKVGYEFFYAHGVKGVQTLCIPPGKLFLDLKLADIGNTNVGALRAILPLQPAYTTLHVSTSLSSFIDAVEYLEKYSPDTQRLAITVLTNVDEDELNILHKTVYTQPLKVSDRVRDLAGLAFANGAHGVVCSGKEVNNISKNFGANYHYACAGIRGPDDNTGDQKRPFTAGEAVRCGATMLVVGRPIVQRINPIEAARKILNKMGLMD